MKANSRRGSLMLGMAGLIAMLFVFSGIIASQSVETYLAAARAERMVQARAAAEGAVVLILQNGALPAEPLAIGDCTVAFSPAAAAPGGMRAVLHVTAKSIERTYLARFTQQQGQALAFLALEVQS